MLIATLWSALGCGNIQEKEQEEEFDAIESTEVESDTGPQLQLYGPSAFTMTIEGCLSGYSATLDQTDTNFNIYKGDLGCVAKLQSFVFNGKTFNPKPGFGFTTYAVGQFASFISTDQTVTYDVHVESQLSSPILLSDLVKYEFGKVIGGDTATGLMSISLGASAKITGTKGGTPVEAPQFTVKAAQLLELNTATTAGKFIFTLQCEQTLTATNNMNNVACMATKLKDLKYALVKDTYSSVPCTQAVQTGCSNIVTQNTLKVITLTAGSGEYIAPGAGGLTYGGFKTKLTSATALIGPTNMAANPNMILMIYNGTSYQYFNVDVRVSQSYLQMLENTDDMVP
jgi:hypothetical protein